MSEPWPAEPAIDNARVSSHVIAFAGACCVGLASLTVWLRAGLGTDARSFSGLDLPVLVLPIIAAAVAVALAVLAEGVTRRSVLRRAGTVAGIVVVLLTALVIVTVESVAAAIPSDFLPAVARRLGVELSVGPGVWLAMVGGVAMIVGARDWRPPFVSAFAGAVRVDQVRRAVPAVVLVFATVLFGSLRYEAWVGASAAGSSHELPGWSLPWIGPLSLVALVLLGAAVLAAALLRLQLAGLLAAAGGWLVTVVAGVVAQAGSTFAKLRLDDLAPAIARRYGPHVELGSATWIAFGTGLLAAAAGAGLLMLAAAPSKETSWPLY